MTKFMNLCGRNLSMKIINSSSFIISNLIEQYFLDQKVDLKRKKQEFGAKRRSGYFGLV